MKDLDTQEWFQQIDAGLKYRQKYGLEKSWAKLENMLYNVDASQANSGPNVMLSTLDSLASAMNVPYPYITVKARNAASLTKSRLLESVDNMLVDSMDFQVEAERCTTCAFLWGKGILKIGYDSEFGWDDTLDIGMTNPTGHTLSRWDSKGMLLEYNKVQPGMPWVACALPHDIVVPWGVYGIQSSPWLAHRVVRHIDAVRSDMKYDRNAARRLEPNMSMEDFVKSYQTVNASFRIGMPEHFPSSPRQNHEDIEYVELWEIRDQRTKRIKVMATGGNEWLRDDPDGLQEIGLPFVDLSFVPRARNFWVTPDAFYLMYHQADLSDIAVQTTKHRRLMNLKGFYDTTRIDKETRGKIENGQIGSLIGIEADGDLSKVISNWLPQSPNPLLYQDAEAVRRNAREVVGFSQNQIGEYEASGRRTATEAQIVQQGAGLRLDRRQNSLRRMYIDAFQQINAIIFEKWKTPRLIEIIGQEGASQWAAVTGQDLRGDYNYKLGFSVGGNETLQERRQVATQMFFSMMQTGLFDPMKLSRYLSAAWNDPEFTATFKDGVINGTYQQSAAGAGQGAQSFQQSQATQGQNGGGNAMGGGQASGVEAGAGLGS